MPVDSEDRDSALVLVVTPLVLRTGTSRTWKTFSGQGLSDTFFFNGAEMILTQYQFSVVPTGGTHFS